MLTKYCWTEVKGDLWYYKQYHYSDEKPRITILILVLILTTPLLIGFDLIVSPFELLYIITYKFMWRKEIKNENKRF